MLLTNINICIIFSLVVALVGGSGPQEGYLYATNPVTKIYGPVCDDYFTTAGVSSKCTKCPIFLTVNSHFLMITKRNLSMNTFE
jgi:hypothetical protein